MLLIQFPNYKELLENFFKFNMIRFQKILHMSQDGLITAILCFYIGIKIDNFFNNSGYEGLNEIIFKACSQIIFIIISVYYIRKLTRFIPFLLRMTNIYNPFHKSTDGEGLIGASIAMGLLLISTQSNMKNRIKKIVNIVYGKRK